jgi:hypothetical protein
MKDEAGGEMRRLHEKTLHRNGGRKGGGSHLQHSSSSVLGSKMCLIQTPTIGCTMVQYSS